MSFLKLAKSPKSLLGAIGLAGGACVLDRLLASLVPGVEGTGAAAAGGTALAVALPYASTFVKELHAKFGDLWANYRASEHAAGPDAKRRADALNHDLELQVGRTLATIVERWSAQQPPAIADAVAALPEQLREFDGAAPRWVSAAEAVELDVGDSFLVAIALGNPNGFAVPRVSAAGWSALLSELARSGKGERALQGYGTLWNRLGEFVEAEFPERFRIDLKAALELHPEAWAAMQFRIDAQILTQALQTQRAIAVTSREVAQTRREVLELGERCARRIAALSSSISSIESATREAKDLLRQSKLALEQLKARPPIELVTLESADAGPARLHYAARRVPHCGREHELASLRDFMTAAPPPASRWKRFTWWLWTGPGGIGKSRIALELALEFEQQLAWDAGFFSRHAHAAFVTSDWKSWSPLRPTLVVFDYAAERTLDISEAIRELHVRDSRGELQHPVRFLLLERDYAGERLIGGLTSECDQGTQLAVANSAFGGEQCDAWHRELAPLSDESLLEAMRNLFERRNQPFDRQVVLALLRRIDRNGRRLLPEGNPLFAAVLAEALITHGAAALRSKTAEELLRRLLANERNHWRDAGVDAGHLNWLVAATLLCRPIAAGREPWPAFQTHVPELCDVREYICELLSSYMPREDRSPTAMYPLEPDRLGELLVLDRLAGFEQVVIRQRESVAMAASAARAVLAAAWESDPQAVTSFALRAARDFAHHPSAQDLALVPFAGGELDESATERAAEHLDQLFAVYRTWDSLGAAARCATESLNLARARVRTNTSARARRTLFVSLRNVAQIELALGHHKQAATQYLEALELGRVLEGELGTEDMQRDLSIVLSDLGRIKLARGLHDEAFALYDESLQRCRALNAAHPSPQARRDVAIALNNVVQIELARGCSDAACALYSESLELSRALACELGTPDARRDACTAIDNVAQIELARARHDDAAKLYGESLQLRRELEAELGTPQTRRELAMAIDNVAGMELATSHYDRAAALYREALALRRELLSELAAPDAQFDLALSHMYLARCVLNDALARHHLSDARHLIRAAIEVAGALPRYAQALAYIDKRIDARGAWIEDPRLLETAS